jgi:hypothetical protein
VKQKTGAIVDVWLDLPKRSTKHGVCPDCCIDHTVRVPVLQSRQVSGREDGLFLQAGFNICVIRSIIGHLPLSSGNVQESLHG